MQPWPVYRVFTGIENAVLAGAVVLELQKIVTVVKCKYVLGFSCVNEFHFVVPFVSKAKFIFIF